MSSVRTIKYKNGSSWIETAIFGIGARKQDRGGY